MDIPQTIAGGMGVEGVDIFSVDIFSVDILPSTWNYAKLLDIYKGLNKNSLKLITQNLFIKQ